MVSAVAATNALRDVDDDDDDALFDRFLFRRAVAPVSDSGALDMLLFRADDEDSRDDNAALLMPLRETLRGARATLPKRRAAVLASARAWLRDERGEYVSDRRLRRCAEAIRAAALACGRTEVVVCVEINQYVGLHSSLSHFSAMTRPSWLGRAVRNRYRHAIEQASRRWRGG